MAALTDSQVKRAGRTLRKWYRGERDGIDFQQVVDALDLLTEFRAQHQAPLAKATMGLRSVVKTEHCLRLEVSQRLKRMPTIIDKLRREPTLNLAHMQDIGGCRAVLSSVRELRRVETRLKKNRPPVGYRDYVTTPRTSGYRGVHLTVVYDGRRIEVQLRTRVMHDWAITVERLSGRLGENLKGDGEHLVQQLLETVSRAMALEEAGLDVDGSLVAELDRRRLDARPYLDGGGS